MQRRKGADKAVLTIRLTPGAREKLWELAQAQGMTMSTWIEQAIRSDLTLVDGHHRVRGLVHTLEEKEEKRDGEDA